MTVGMYLLVALFFAPPHVNEPGNPSTHLMIVVLTASGTFLVIISFVVKQRILQRSVEKQDVNLVQKGLVIACAMCEISALLGLIERFTIGNREYYWLFLLAAAGIAFHFPRRSQLESASYMNPMKLV
jgi:NADH:ubiquinone oxidoreductase subunit 2 (subunit N)